MLLTDPGYQNQQAIAALSVSQPDCVKRSYLKPTFFGNLYNKDQKLIMRNPYETFCHIWDTLPEKIGRVIPPLPLFAVL